MMEKVFQNIHRATDSKLGVLTTKMNLKTALCELFTGTFRRQFRYKRLVVVSLLCLSICWIVLIIRPSHPKLTIKRLRNDSNDGLISVVSNLTSQQAITTQLLLFTTWSFKPEKRYVYDSVFVLWESWQPLIKPVLFSSDPHMRKMALKKQWPVLNETRNPRCNGMPLLPDMFLTVFNQYRNISLFGFANGDIVFGEGLQQTVAFLHSNKDFAKRPFLMIGRRTNYNFTKVTKPLRNIKDVKRLKTEGDLVKLSSDYFITNRHFPWKNIPALSIGRPGFARWVISYAIKHKITLIDTTNTVQALHLTTADGTHSSWNAPRDQKRCNLNFIVKQEHIEMDLGYVECATVFTYRDPDGRIKLRKRQRQTDICKGSYK